MGAWSRHGGHCRGIERDGGLSPRLDAVGAGPGDGLAPGLACVSTGGAGLGGEGGAPLELEAGLSLADGAGAALGVGGGSGELSVVESTLSAGPAAEGAAAGVEPCPEIA